MVIIFVISWILLEALYEALYDNSKKPLSKAFAGLTKLGILVALFYLDIEIPLWKLILGYAFVRLFIFDYAYNLIRGLKWNYIGSTTFIYDKITGWVDMMWGSSSVLFLKFIFGVVGISFLL